MLTYGDGVADVDISRSGRISSCQRQAGDGDLDPATGAFRCLGISADGIVVEAFKEKPKGDGGWINGGFFVLQPEGLRL